MIGVIVHSRILTWLKGMQISVQIDVVVKVSIKMVMYGKQKTFKTFDTCIIYHFNHGLKLEKYK